jgi:hypothetical protein
VSELAPSHEPAARLEKTRGQRPDLNKCTPHHANNPLEADHGRLKARLRPMRGLKRDRTANVIVVGHAFVQNLRRGFYDLGTDVPPDSRLAAVRRAGSRDLIPAGTNGSTGHLLRQRNSARRQPMQQWRLGRRERANARVDHRGQ